MLMLKLKQAGDTIVEVLIAIGVVSAIIGGAYASSNHSLRGSLQAQEHSVALKLAESQMESLDAYIKSSSSNKTAIFSNNYLFCFTITHYFQRAHDGGNVGTQQFGQLPPNDSDNFSDYNVGCTNNVAIQGLNFYIAIDKTGSNTFIAHVRWDSAVGSNHDEELVAYKALP